MAKKTEFQITIGYKAIVCVNVKADNKQEAEKKALEIFSKGRKFPGCELEDDNFKIDGTLDMDRTWNMCNN